MADEALETNASDEAMVVLPLGETFNLSGVYELCSKYKSNLVCCIGGVGAGKTTLIARIYDYLNSGSIGGWLFSGSETLKGFEQLLCNHRAEVVSGVPVVERTRSSEDPEVLNLNLYNRESAEFKSLLLLNISGELFRELVLNAENLHSLGFLARADDICIMLDGDKFSSKPSAETEIRNMRIVLDRILKGSILASPKRFQISIAKIDSYEKSQISPEVKKTIAEKIEQELISPLRQFGHQASSVIYELQTEPFSESRGMDHLIKEWCRAKDKSEANSKTKTASSRYFHHFKSSKV